MDTCIRLEGRSRVFIWPLFRPCLFLLTQEGQGQGHMDSGSRSLTEFTLGLCVGDPGDSQHNPAVPKADVNRRMGKGRASRR